MKKIINNNLKEFRRKLADLLADVAGSFALSVGIYCFSEKVNIAPGGVSGIAIMIKYLFNLPVGIIIIVINTPLLIFAYKRIGKSFTLRTVRTLVINTIVLDAVVTPLFPQYEGERILGAIFGGVFMGLGLGIIFMRGSTTAGTDILSFLIERKYPYIPIGKALMLIDGMILGGSFFVFKNMESVLFGIVALYCQTQVIDKIVYGLDKSSEILCVSKKNDVIAFRVINELGRSATFLNAQGAYSKSTSSVLMCIIRSQEYAKLKEIIYSEDQSAFVVVSEATKVMGEGFNAAVMEK